MNVAFANRHSLGFALLFVVRYYRYNSLLSLVLGQKLRLDAWDRGLWSALSLSLEREGKFPHLSSSQAPRK